ncbi:glycosyltransferase [Galbitalea sp. SE-J8]|uniref:glycosyltransferase n=1 Tax=Galbitalea sp. SE-J8 TaxID=3054952 RepID=UPI00259C6CD3|nr:glycosyltransferase [Galbitalea sp. SE-J8]MDM4762984.1 glycosyltransferase [Galbitalea sp. SE-J8]
MSVYAKDRADFFREAFRSVTVGQRLRPDEVVLVQDGPVPDDLAAAIEQEVAASVVPVVLVPLERNQGLAHALTAGLERCAHDVVARMDADDIAMPERFAKQLPLIDEGFELVGTGMFEFGDGGVLGTRTPPVGEDVIRSYATFHDPFNHPTVVYRRSAVERAGAYQPLALMEDYWLFVRMIKDGARVANVPDPLLKYRVDSGAYQRRGGAALFRSELALQKRMRRAGYTTRAQYLRNVVVRGGYRFVPVGIRRIAYRLIIAPGRR